MLRLGQEPPGGVPVALKHLQLQEERGPHVPLHQPPERLLGLQSPEQPHGLQAGEAASRQRGAAAEVQLPVVLRLVAGAGLEEVARLVPQGRPQRDLLPRAEALHGDGQRLIEEAAGGGREADGGGHGGKAAGYGRPGGQRGAAATRGSRRGAEAGPAQPPLAVTGARPAQGEGSDPPHGPRRFRLGGQIPQRFPAGPGLLWRGRSRSAAVLPRREERTAGLSPRLPSSLPAVESSLTNSPWSERRLGPGNSSSVSPRASQRGAVDADGGTCGKGGQRC